MTYEKQQPDSKPLVKRPEQDASGRFVKGNCGGVGRVKGSKNKFTLVKEAMLEAMEQAKAGDSKGLSNWLIMVADKDPVSFLRCVVSILPKEVKSEVNQRVANNVDIKATISAMSHDELCRLADVADEPVDEPSADKPETDAASGGEQP